MEMSLYYPVVSYKNDWIGHHGILGQKWGRRNGPPYPIAAGNHSSAEKKAGGVKTYSDKTLRSKSDVNKEKEAERFPDPNKDFKLSKNTTFYRVSVGKESKLGDRTYVSMSKSKYVDDSIIGNNFDNAYISTYKPKQTSLVAGKDSINRILKEIGEEPLSDKSSNNDFFYNNPDKQKKFINQAMKEGYQAILDPVDSDIGKYHISKSATIFLGDSLKKYGEISLNDYYKF